ncbi:tetratricopeptide repeat protein [Kiloniella sp.]|uniref:O-linked N-acetylglucosamine transferase family protein n=1 Tax=Kiloniella sp. TaxID=1938587 RepID=UPI003A95507F
MELISKKMSKDDARLRKALDLVLSQNFFEAIQFCEQYLRKKKNSALNFVYGHALIRVNRQDEARVHLKNISLKTVKDAYCLYQMAHLAYELEEYNDAIVCYQRAAIYEKGFWEAYYNLGNAFKKIFKYKEAKEAYLKALKINSTYIDLLYNFAQVLESLTELDNAVSYYNKVLGIKADDSGAITGIGRCYYLQKGFEDAKPFWLRALEINPVSYEAYDAIVGGYISQGDFVRAQIFLDKAIDAGVQHQTVFLNMARVLYMGENNSKLAREVLTQAVEFYPRVAELWNLLLGIMIENAEYDDAEKILNDLFLEGMEVWYLKLGMSKLLFETSRINEAEEVVKEILELKPDNGVLISALLAMMSYNPKHTADELFSAHKHYGALLESGIGKAGFLTPRKFKKEDGKPIKVGYVSPDFRDHATSRFIEPIIANHDRDKFHVTLYSGNKIEDKVTVRLKEYANAWCNTNIYDDFQLAQKFQEDEIDILVDLAGHTPGNRLGAFGYKPCPVQVSFVGYPYTTGMKSIDYYFANETLVPRDNTKYFVEKVLYLPFNNKSIRESKVHWLPDGIGPVENSPNIEKGYFTFGCFNRLEKISEELLFAWIEILKRVPNSKLILKNRNFDSKKTRSEFIARFCEKGIEQDRLDFRGSSDLRTYLETFNEIDIGLDTYPYNGSTVSFDSLAMCVSFITLSGEGAQSRIGMLLNKSRGLEICNASSFDDYINKAVSLVNSPDILAMHRKEHIRRLANAAFDYTVMPLEELFETVINQKG